MKKIGINGFGRIGRVFLRLIINKKNSIRVKFVNEINTTPLSDSAYIQNLIYLFVNDSVYGNINKKFTFSKNTLLINDQKIEFIVSNIKKINYKKYKIDTLVDCSGVNNVSYKNIIKKENFKVVISSNSDQADFTLVHGVNNKDYLKNKHKLISASTCTGQAFIPFAKLIDDNYTIVNGFINTVHPCLSSDLLNDSSKLAFHYGRSLKNVKLVETNIVKSTLKVIPNLKNKLFSKSLSYRIPTDIVTSIFGVIQVSKEINSKKKILKLIKNNQKNIYVCNGFNKNPLVSLDYLKNKYPCIITSEWLDVSNKNLIRFHIWHDNEFGYCYQLYNTVLFINE